MKPTVFLSDFAPATHIASKATELATLRKAESRTRNGQGNAQDRANPTLTKI
jgi:hypothetical protein